MKKRRARRSPLQRLMLTATGIAGVAACSVALVVFQFSIGAAKESDALVPIFYFTGACFLLAWPAAFTLGWVYMRARGRVEEPR